MIFNFSIVGVETQQHIDEYLLLRVWSFIDLAFPDSLSPCLNGYFLHNYYCCNCLVCKCSLCQTT